MFRPENISIVPHPFSQDPHQIWEDYCDDGRIFETVDKLISPTDPIKSNFIRFVCISDTHEKMADLLPRIPPGDVLIHCGDFTDYGEKEQILKFNEELGTLPHKYKIVIAGNHEFGFEGNEDWVLRNQRFKGKGTDKGYELLTNCIYLHDSNVTLYGINIYGSPWHPKNGFSFYQKRGEEILQRWNQIPVNTDILLTHVPPLGHGDSVNGIRTGCAELLNTVEKRVEPKYHIFGHIHESPGISTNKKTFFINAASCDRLRRIANNPIVFDFPLPEGISKD
uniref:Calcineurin-like phosphoesterase domain-containing protein n=1 Tax=Panagrolaimus superbus TaxID=310955 RepID=A0A914YRM1_9BILA